VEIAFMPRIVFLLTLLTTLLLTSITLLADHFSPTKVDLLAAPQLAGRLTLPVLTAGEPVQGKLTAGLDAQLYLFNGRMDDEVTIIMTQDSADTLDPFLLLMDARGRVIAYNDDDHRGSLGLAAGIRNVDLPKDGTYIVMATSLGGVRSPMDPSQGAPRYTLTASGFTTPATMDRKVGQFFGGILGIGQSVQLAITERERVYFFAFAGQAETRVNIRTGLGRGIEDSLVFLFNSHGTRLAVNDDSNGLAAELLNIELPRDEMYIVWVTRYGFEDIAYKSDSPFAFLRLSIDPAP
jgi:hypothetical protein